MNHKIRENRLHALVNRQHMDMTQDVHLAELNAMAAHAGVAPATTFTMAEISRVGAANVRLWRAKVAHRTENPHA